MLLAIDIGNTNIVFGIFDGETLSESWRLATLRERTADELWVLVSRLFEERRLDRTRVSGIVLSSVVPPLTATVTEMVRGGLRAGDADGRRLERRSAHPLSRPGRRRRRPAGQRRGGAGGVRRHGPADHRG